MRERHNLFNPIFLYVRALCYRASYETTIHRRCFCGCNMMHNVSYALIIGLVLCNFVSFIVANDVKMLIFRIKNPR